MGKKTAIQPPASSSEEESSSEEDSQLKEKKRESESEYEETDGEYSEDETEDSEPKPKSVTENPTKIVQEGDDGLLEEEESESEDSDTKPNSVCQNPTEKIQEDGGSSEESNSEEEESEQEENIHVPNHVNNGNKKPQTKMVPPTADSIKIKSGSGDSKNKPILRVWTLEDEKTLLNSMLQFRLEEGKEVDPSTLEYFCEFLKGKLSFTKRPRGSQVSQKIKALKKNYSRNRFTKKHELELEEIATQLWERKSSKRKFSLLKEEIGKFKNIRLDEKLKSRFNVEKAEALEQKIKKQKILEMKQELKKMNLKKEIFKVILDVLEKKL